MLTDACAACVPYCGGYAHWGMLEAAKWMVEHELERVVAICREQPGYKLLLVGHSLGAGEEGGQKGAGKEGHPLGAGEACRGSTVWGEGATPGGR
jgi:sn1-specific diacylglycerol lipase